MAGGTVAGGRLPPIVTILLGALGTLIGLILVGGLLIFTGSPSACAARDIPYSSASSQELRAQYKALAVRGGRQLHEGAGHVRGVDFVNEKGAPVEDLQVYFCPQGARGGIGQVKILGLKSKVVVRGTRTSARPRSSFSRCGG